MSNKRRLTLREAMAKAPQLTDFGFGLHHEHRQKTPREWQEKFERERDALARNNTRFLATCAWIAENLEMRKSIGYGCSSYGLKHIAEKEIGYISNGCFIASMIALGYDWEVEGPNAFFNVTRRSIKQAEKRVEEYRKRGNLESTYAGTPICARAENCITGNLHSTAQNGAKG